MKPALYLRIASAAVMVQAALHTVGGVFGTPRPGAAAIAAAAMKTNHFPVTGLDRTYWDFYIGFGFASRSSCGGRRGVLAAGEPGGEGRGGAADCCRVLPGLRVAGGAGVFVFLCGPDDFRCAGGDVAGPCGVCIKASSGALNRNHTLLKQIPSGLTCME